MPTDFFSGDNFQPWTLAQIYADLASRRDVAIALNINERRLADWLRRRDVHNCPRPVTRVGPTDVYSIQEWRDWFAKYLEKHPWLVDTCREHEDKEKQMDWFLNAE